MDSEFIRNLIGLAGVPLIIALVQLCKPFVSDTRWYPPISVGFGLLINLVAAWALGSTTRVEWVAAFFMGILAGLAASGLYSAGATLREPAAVADKSKRPPGPPPGAMYHTMGKEI